MGGACPNASENGQISPSPIVRAARGDDGRPNHAAVLQSGRINASVHASTGVIWGIPVNDSLPDGWGKLLLDRCLQKQNYDHRALGPLDRLAYVGTTGMGALRYIPDKTFGDSGINLCQTG